MDSSYVKLRSLIKSNDDLCKRAIQMTEVVLKEDIVAEDFSDVIGINPLLVPRVDLDDRKRETFSSLKDYFETTHQTFASLEVGAEKKEFNEPYIKHSISRIQNLNSLIEEYLAFAKIVNTDKSFKESDFLNVAERLRDALNPNLDDLYEHFKYGDKNYIIFGKNGAGKTSLLKKVTTDIITENTVIIPANRIVSLSDSNYFNQSLTYDLNEKLADKNSIQYLAGALLLEENKEYRHKVPESDNIYTKFRRIFNKLGLERGISIESNEIKLYLPNKQGEIEKYSLSQASDGERTVVYMILAVLLAPYNAYIFIDEPENHLNGSLMLKLFDALELARSDARFIYLTHKTDFIESRTNFQLIYLEKTDQPNKWSYKDISDYKDISLSTLLDIEGSLDNIIFCEGTKSSIDFKMLTALYPDFTVRPSGSCVDVKRNTEAINLQSSLFRRHAIGVVDGDFQSKEEIDSLCSKRILTLQYNEWESLLLDDEILLAINNKVGYDDISTVKTNIISEIKRDRVNILNDYLTKRYSAIINKNRIRIDQSCDVDADVDAALELNINTINAKNKETILDMYKQFSSTLDSLISADNYASLIKLIPGKQLLSTAAHAVHLGYARDYINVVLRELRINTEFKDTVDKKIKLNEFYKHCFPHD